MRSSSHSLVIFLVASTFVLSKPQLAGAAGAASGGSTAGASALALSETPSAEIFEEIAPRLIRRGVKREFLRSMISDPLTRFEEKALRLMILQFRSKPADYSYATTAEAVDKTAQFLAEHGEALARCEKRTGVPRETMGALMWVETKLGARTGSYSVASVYLTLAMASRKSVVEGLKAYVRSDFKGSPRELREALRTVEKRAKKFSEWGIQEVVALQKIQDRFGVRFARPVWKLQGSWAGAFGMAQFIPSTYLKLAQDGDLDDRFDPYSVADSACSVGNFLSKNGWGRESRRQKKALMRYNRSSDYGKAILELSRMIRPEAGRRIASTPQPSATSQR